MAQTWTSWQTGLDDRIQDSAKKLTGDARDRALKQAIAMRYSHDRPRRVVSDITCDGTVLAALPTTDAGLTPFDPLTGEIVQLEYPLGQIPVSTIEDADWQLYETPTGWKIQFLATTPGSGETVRAIWTTPHKADGSTVPDSDFDAVCDLAAALCFEKMAAIYLQTVDPTLQSDSVNYRTKGQEALSLAKTYRRRYFDHLGIAEGDQGQVQAGPAISIGEMDLTMGPGVDRIIHNKRTR